MGKCLQSSKANASMLGNLKISLRIFAKFFENCTINEISKDNDYDNCFDYVLATEKSF